MPGAIRARRLAGLGSSDAMKAAEIIALVSVVGSALVALGVSYIGARRDDKRTAQQINAGRLDELRGVLEEAAQALFETLDAMEHARQKLRKTQVSIGPDPLGPPHIHSEGRWGASHHLHAFSEAYLEVRRVENRIAIRLGVDDHLTNTFMAAREALRAVLGMQQHLLTGGEWTQDVDEQLVLGEQIAVGARQEFVKVAASLVGPKTNLKLPPELTQGETQGIVKGTKFTATSPRPTDPE